jgi:magnesium transporter
VLRIIKKTSKKAGLSPGTLVHIGERKAETAQFSLMNYDPEQLQELITPYSTMGNSNTRRR